MATNIIGRKNELSAFDKLKASKKSEFVAVFGRRRVGKTFLIRETFSNSFDFYLTGMANVTLVQQLANFQIALKKYDRSGKDKTPAENWLMAFQQLIEILEANKSPQKVIFLDELPWLDTAKSGFVTALEHFWNAWASARKDILLIVCGSAASWMINKLIHNTGGLHNRVTQRIQLEPFTLNECELFLKSKGGVYDRYQIVQLYMVMGGIPFYLDQIDTGMSAAQNIDQLCFQPNGLLATEFDGLYKSLFNKAEKHVAIIEALSKKAKGMGREELVKESKLANGGSITRILKELEESGFIRKYNSFGKKGRDSLYQLSDLYSMFYLKFIKDSYDLQKGAWLNGADNPKQRAWSGYAFEQVCLSHVPEIKQALGISGIQTAVSAWTGDKAQIDLVIDRRDGVVNLFEIKFSINDFTINKKYADELRNKVNSFKEATGTRKAIFLTMITTFGLAKKEYAISLVQNDFTMDPLFKTIG